MNIRTDKELAAVAERIDAHKARISRILEQRLTQAVAELSLQHAGYTVTASSALGGCHITASAPDGIEEDIEVQHPVLRLFAEVDDAYGFEVLPVAFLVGERGEVKRRNDSAWEIVSAAQSEDDLDPLLMAEALEDTAALGEYHHRDSVSVSTQMLRYAAQAIRMNNP